MNLLAETIDFLKDNGKTPDDVKFVQSSQPELHSFSWAEFAAYANKEYDNGYGGNEVYIGLRIVGDTWWLERGEYDGSEWWEYKEKPEQAPYKAPFESSIWEES